MKKAISMLLVLMLCLSMCACAPASEGNTTDPKMAYVGEWKANVLAGNSGDGREYEVAVIQLNEDGTGTYKGQELTWELSADGTTVKATTNHITVNFEIDVKDGKTTLNFFDDTYYRASEFVETNG